MTHRTTAHPDRFRRSLLQAAAISGGASVLGIPLDTLAQAARGGVVVIGSTQRPGT